MIQSTQSNQAGSLSQGYQGLGAAAIPREKGPLSNAQEALGYLSELESLNAEIRRKLYGPFPQEDQSNSAIIPREQSLEEMLRWICQRTALAVGGRTPTALVRPSTVGVEREGGQSARGGSVMATKSDNENPHGVVRVLVKNGKPLTERGRELLRKPS